MPTPDTFSGGRSSMYPNSEMSKSSSAVGTNECDT
jgi:hypothetical protein